MEDTQQQEEFTVQPGSWLEKFIDFMRGRNGAWTTREEFGQAFGAPAKSLVDGSLARAVEAGVVEKQKMGAPIFATAWRYPGPITTATEGQPDRGLGNATGLVATGGSEQVDPGEDDVSGYEEEEARMRVDVARQAAPAEDSFACALMSDGRFYFEMNGDSWTIPEPCTRNLLRYIDRLRQGTLLHPGVPGQQDHGG